MLHKIGLFNRTQQTSGFFDSGSLLDPTGKVNSIEDTDELVIAHSVHSNDLSNG